MRYLLTATTWMVALVFIAVSAMMNFTFAASLGKTPLEGHIFGTISLASDAFKALLPLLLAQAWRNRRHLQLIVGSVMFVVFTVVSLLSAVGFASSNRQAVTRVSDADNERAAANRQARAGLDARIAALPAHRPIAVVTEAQAGAQQDKRWATSKNCTSATEVKSRQFCAAYFELRAELATATEAAKLRDERDALQTAALAQNTGAVPDADPQATVVASVLAANKSSVQRLLVLMIAIIVEIGSGFGLYVAMQSWKGPEVESGREPAQEITESEPEIQTPEPVADIAPEPTLPAPTAPTAPAAEPLELIEVNKRVDRDPDIIRAILRRPGPR
jgi:hypothetical protein